MDLTGNTFFDGPAGRIEAILKAPPGAVGKAAVVCHPHPLFGGTMHNKVVFRIAKSLNRAGFAVLRFNFRGVGRSEGRFDDGVGEQDDLRAAIRFVEQSYPGAGVCLAGFSFGAAMGLRAGCGDSRIRALILAGLPASKHEFGQLSGCTMPKLIVQGSRDEFGSVEAIERLFASLGEPKQLAIIEGADHFFEGHLDRLEQVVFEFARDAAAT